MKPGASWRPEVAVVWFERLWKRVPPLTANCGERLEEGIVDVLRDELHVSIAGNELSPPFVVTAEVVSETVPI